MMTETDRAEQIEDRSPEERSLRLALGKRIRQLRKKRGWTQAELASKLGATRCKLVRWERGALPPLRMQILLSDVFGVALDALLAGRRSEKEEALTQDQKRTAVRHLNQLASLLRLRPHGTRE